ncbi:MAG: sialidase family protein [Polyangiales bacterium]
MPPDGGAGRDASVPDASFPSDGAVASDGGTDGGPPEGTPVLLALGGLGRTMSSCDEGRTWRHDTDFARAGDPVFCGESQTLRCDMPTPARWAEGETCNTYGDWNCDHNPGSSMGVLFTGDRFVGVWGWGSWGTSRVSEDGVSWRVTRSDRFTYNRLWRLAGGRLFATATQPRVSTDGGESWSPTRTAPPFGDGVYNVRAQGVLQRPGGGERVWLLGQDSASAIAYSDDGGDSWTTPTLPPAECRNEMLGFYQRADEVHLISGAGDCISTDQGASWSFSPWSSVGVEAAPHVAFQVGDAIFVHSNAEILRNDAGTWQRLAQPNRWPSATFFLGDGWISFEGRPHTEGTIVRTSTDGVAWNEVAGATVPAGPSIRQVVRGWVPSTACE